MTKCNYKSILEITLNEFFLNFIKNPYCYFYEEDIRVDLVKKLIERTDYIELSHFNKNIITSPIKCEYPSSLATKQRHDIVFVKSNDSK